MQLLYFLVMMYVLLKDIICEAFCVKYSAQTFNVDENTKSFLINGHPI